MASKKRVPLLNVKITFGNCQRILSNNFHADLEASLN